jgi:hypothetical protein
MCLWRALASEGKVLHVLVRRRRETGAALRLMRRLLETKASATAHSRPTGWDRMVQPLDSLASSAGIG